MTKKDFSNQPLIKKILIITLVVILNLILILLALIIYNWFTVPIMRTTGSLRVVDAIIGCGIIIMVIVSFVTFLMSRRFRWFGIGGTAMTIAGIIFLVYYLNRSLATKGDYEDFELREATVEGSCFLLNIGFNDWYNSTQVTADKCVKVDSVKVRVDHGLFGMPTMSDDVRIVETENCNLTNQENAILTNDHLSMGKNLVYHRCFEKAIEHFSDFIALDSLNYDGYYERGLVFMVMEKYDKALADLLTAASLKTKKFNPQKVEPDHEAKQAVHIEELLGKIERNDTAGIKKFLEDNSFGSDWENMNVGRDLEECNRRIEFCKARIRGK
jgi:hypothetical protein